MTYLTKEFTTTYKTIANHHELITKGVKLELNGDYIFSNVEMHSYTDKASFDTDGKKVDCFQSKLTYTVTRAERDAETDTEDDIRVKKALLKKITASVLVADVETNIWHGNIGEFNYIGAVV